MRRLKGHIPLTRRLLGQYLMFALASVAALGAGLLLVAHMLHGRPHEHTVLDLLDDTAAAIARDLHEQEGREAQRLVDRAAIEGELHYCAVLSSEGTFLFHSSRELAGRTAPSPVPALKADYVVERLHLARGGAGSLTEYSKPLVHQGKTLGVLQFGVVPYQPQLWVQRLLDYAPPAMFVPFLLLVIGGKVIAGSLRTSSAVEERLAQASWLPADATASLLPVEDDGPVAAGWNRLAQHLQKARPASNLEKKLESALSGLRDKRAEQAIQAIPEGIALTDHDGRALLVNEALCALIGVEAESLRGGILFDRLPWNESRSVDRSAFDEPLRPAIIEIARGAAVAEGVLRVARHPLPAEGDSLPCHVWLVRDVTQQKLAEEAREQFVYSATHELRTPLANIKAYSETLSLHEFDDEEQRKRFLNTINVEASRLARFVDDLLNISQMEAGSLSLHLQKTDFQRLIAETVEKVRPQMDQKRMTFDVVLPAKVPDLTLDKEHFIAALVNILGNAAKYTPEEGKVTLRIEQDDEAVHIHIEDTGIGISKEELPKLGSKFFRSSDPRVQDATGTGLGLAFTGEVIRLHGAKLNIHSELDKGSRFTVSVPVS